MERTPLIAPSHAPQWLVRSLNDPEITDLCINGPTGVFIDRGSGMEPLLIPESEPIHEPFFRDWIIEELSKVGKTWDAKNPFVDATLSSGHRAHVAFPPLSRQGLLISLRRQAAPSLGGTRWQTSPLYRQAYSAVTKGESVLICGATGSGKTTLAGDLLSQLSPSERIIALEDTPELAPAHPHFLSLISRPPNSDGHGEITLRTLLRQTLRMRPDRIILGECRGPEVLELLQALNTGHRGAMGTLHANSPRDALRRIELLCLLATGGTLPISGIRDLLAAGIQWVIQVKREGAIRKISEIWHLEGREGDTILMRPVIE